MRAGTDANRLAAVFLIIIRNSKKRAGAISPARTRASVFAAVGAAEAFVLLAGMAVARRANEDGFQIAFTAAFVVAAACDLTADGLLSAMVFHGDPSLSRLGVSALV